MQLQVPGMLWDLTLLEQTARVLTAAPLDKAHTFNAHFIPFSDVRDNKTSAETYSLDQVGHSGIPPATGPIRLTCSKLPAWMPAFQRPLSWRQAAHITSSCIEPPAPALMP